MIIGRVVVTVDDLTAPTEVVVATDVPNTAGFYGRRRTTTLTYDGELQDQMEAEIALALPENEPE